MSSVYHQSYQSPLIHQAESVDISPDPGTWTLMDFTVPVEKDRYWLFIPHPGFDFRVSWDGGATYVVYTEEYLTPVLQGIHRDEEVYVCPDTQQVGPTVALNYFLLLPFFNRIL